MLYIDDITVNGLLLIKMVYSEVEQVSPFKIVREYDGNTCSTSLYTIFINNKPFKIISTLDSEIAIQISDTDITRQIEMNYVFRIGMRNYSVVNIDDITVIPHSNSKHVIHLNLSSNISITYLYCNF